MNDNLDPANWTPLGTNLTATSTSLSITNNFFPKCPTGFTVCLQMP